jgi:hypothetical protein
MTEGQVAVRGFAFGQNSVPLRALESVRGKSNFVSDINPIWGVQTDSEKFPAFAVGQISASTPAIPSHTEGRIAIVTDVGYGMRWTQQCQKTNDVACGRRSRVVLAPRRWCQVSRDNPRDDGGKKARSPGRARKKPLKPLRREGRVFPVNLW